MIRTQFAGLTALEAGESLQTDNASFLTDNPPKIDRLLRIGCVLHRHDGHAALGLPSAAAGASAVATGGTIPGAQVLYVGYTLHDYEGGETSLSPLTTVTTADPIDPPASTPSAVADYTGGELPADVYYYALSYIDAEGGETPLGPSVAVEREQGFASGRIQLSGLRDPMLDVGATGWRLWRAAGAGDFFYIAQDSTDTFTDEGASCVDCGLAPVAETYNFTNGTNSVDTEVPAPLLSGASAFSLYMSPTADFSAVSRHGVFPPASAAATITITTLVAEDHRPPDVSTCIPGASPINALTDIVNLEAALTASGIGGGGGLVNPLGTEIVWTDDNGSAAVKLIGNQRTDEEPLYTSSFFDDPDGAPSDPPTAGNSYYVMSGGVAQPSGASHNNLDTTTYWAGLTTFPGIGRFQRSINIVNNSWRRLGVGFGAGTPGQGVVAWIQNLATPELQLAYRIDGSGGGNNDAGWVVFAAVPLPGVIADGTYFDLNFVVERDMMSATLVDGKTVLAEIEATELPDPAKASWGFALGGTRNLMTADRWITEDSFSFDWIAMYGFTYVRELRAQLFTEDTGSEYDTVLVDTSPKFSPLSKAAAGESAIGADWLGNEGTEHEARTWNDQRNPQTTYFTGRLTRASAAASAVAGDVLVMLTTGDPRLPQPIGDRLIPVVTGDDDGEELGWVKVDYFNGVVSWQAGRSTDPATKHPWVDLAGVYY